MQADENARLDQAMRRAEDLLVGSLRQDDRRRRRRRIAVLACVLGIGCMVALIARNVGPDKPDAQVIIAQRSIPDSQPSESLSAKLLALGDDWRKTLDVGNQVAAADPDAAWAALSGNWSRIAARDARQQILKAFVFRSHPRVLDVLDLGINDPDPKVQAWAMSYLRNYAFQDFAENRAAYAEWRKRTAGKPVANVVADEARAYVERLKATQGEELKLQARFITHARNGLRDYPAARDAAIGAGALDVAIGWLREHPGDQDVRDGAATLLSALKPDEAYLRATVLPLLTDKTQPLDVREIAARLLGQPGNTWAVEPLLAMLRETLETKSHGGWNVAQALGEIDDPRAIPHMIAIIAADNTYDTVYGVGYFGLAKITGVRYDESHDGAWWKQWWERERQRFPEPAKSATVPAIERRKATEQSASHAARPIFAMMLAEHGEPPVKELAAGGNEKMKFFLIGPKAETAPREGYRLLLVLPGGDGGADFKPFVTNILNEALPDNYLVAQLVAPQWSDREDRIVWPTEKSRDPKMKFTTEAFIDAVIEDVSKEHKIDAKHVYALGWSSGGPPVYAAAMRAKTSLTGAFVAMSVFKPAELPPAKKLEGRAFYILHSPQDFIRMTFPRNAEKTLAAAGAKSTLATYEGGHGWKGDMFGNIRTGMKWLEKQPKVTPKKMGKAR